MTNVPLTLTEVRHITHLLTDARWIALHRAGDLLWRAQAMRAIRERLMAEHFDAEASKDRATAFAIEAEVNELNALICRYSRSERPRLIQPTASPLPLPWSLSVPNFRERA